MKTTRKSLKETYRKAQITVENAVELPLRKKNAISVSDYHHGKLEKTILINGHFQAPANCMHYDEVRPVVPVKPMPSIQPPVEPTEPQPPTPIQPPAPAPQIIPEPAEPSVPVPGIPSPVPTPVPEVPITPMAQYQLAA